ncbi:MAG: hypothetical protein QOE28_189 [Solirubrobacteraceae bacterium]|jgi:hypothetical protein|nr:hypothetical protein [Solirubrobacteraceae bacterium]
MAARSTRNTGFRRRRAGAAATAARLQIARAARLIAGLAALILLIGIVLVLLKANGSNQIVSAIHDAASWLAGPFDGMFTLSHKRVETAVNWGIAAVVWYLAGHLIARLIAR